MSIESIDANNMQLKLSELGTNVVYEIQVLDKLPVENQTIISQDFIYATSTTTNISLPVISTNGFTLLDTNL